MSGILFISKKCNHCVELVNMINKTELNFEIKIIDIKNMQDMPDFLDRVPLLLIESENKILHDEELFNFMKKCVKNIEPFMINEMRGLSDTYSFMEDEEQKMDHQYVFLENGDPVITSSIVNEEENRKIKNYDNFIEERDKDIKEIFQKQSISEI